MSAKHILLLTATIQPRAGQPSLAVTDPAVRLQEYETALAFYAGLLQRGALHAIVFAENSGFDLGPLAARFPVAGIEWISAPDLDYPLGYHRGYGEFRLVDAAMQRSTHIREAGADARVWKVSGRYIVSNLGRVLRWAPRRFDFYCAMKKGWAEMSALAWSPEGYRHAIEGIWRSFDSAMPPELILYQRFELPPSARLRVVRSFNWPPFIVGRRGSDGSSFEGRFTRYRHGLTLAGRLATLPLRQLFNA